MSFQNQTRNRGQINFISVYHLRNTDTAGYVRIPCRIRIRHGYSRDTYPRHVHVSLLIWAGNSRMDTSRPSLDTAQPNLPPSHSLLTCSRPPPTRRVRTLPPPARGVQVPDSPTRRPDPPPAGNQPSPSPATRSPCDGDEELHPASNNEPPRPATATKSCARDPSRSSNGEPWPAVRPRSGTVEDAHA